MLNSLYKFEDKILKCFVQLNFAAPFLHVLKYPFLLSSVLLCSYFNMHNLTDQIPSTLLLPAWAFASNINVSNVENTRENPTLLSQ
jgi:hypothetical protein